MRRLTFLFLVTVATLAFAVPAQAAVPRKPTVSSVAPMRVATGAGLRVGGRNFSAVASRNTVIFQTGRRSIFVKPRRSSHRVLVLTVPRSLERLMGVDSAGRRRPTRFTLRVVTNRLFGAATPPRLSPVVVGTAGVVPGPGGGTTPTVPTIADCDRDGISNDSDSASDVDLLTDAYERSIGTDPCDADSDDDGVEDGYEQQSAIDLNRHPAAPPLPYPGKRPYPNALDPTDANTDYDGDSLRLREEFLLWVRYSADGVARAGRPTALTGLVYSDGVQKSIDPAPFAPADVRTDWALDLDENGRLEDDDRDGDGDGLSNYDESHGQFTEAWWPAQHNGVIEPKESQYPEIDFLDNEDLAQRDGLADPDMDGDGVLDGEDDHDHDGLSNQFEVRRPGDWFADAITDGVDSFPNARNPWAYTNPFNPCKPFNSERCHSHPPFGHYANDQVPPVGPNPPADHHLRANQPDTPNGL